MKAQVQREYINAVINNDVDSINQYLENNGDVNASHLLEVAVHKKYKTPVYVHAVNANHETFKHLYNNRMDFSGLNKDHNKILQYRNSDNNPINPENIQQLIDNEIFTPKDEFYSEIMKLAYQESRERRTLGEKWVHLAIKNKPNVLEPNQDKEFATHLFDIHKRDYIGFARSVVNGAKEQNIDNYINIRNKDGLTAVMFHAVGNELSVDLSKRKTAIKGLITLGAEISEEDISKLQKLNVSNDLLDFINTIHKEQEKYKKEKIEQKDNNTELGDKPKTAVDLSKMSSRFESRKNKFKSTPNIVRFNQNVINTAKRDRA